MATVGDFTDAHIGGIWIRSGTGSPEGVVTGSIGDVYLRTDGGVDVTLYVKEANNGLPTGWTAIGSAGGSSVSGINQLSGDVIAGPGTGAQTATIAAGAVTETKLGLSDVTTANTNATQHGLAPKTPNDATKYLDGTGAWSTPPGSGSGISQLTGDVTAGPGSGSQTATIGAGAVTEGKIGLSDVTTDDVSTSKHGFCPKAPGDTTKFLSGDGTWRSGTGAVAAQIAQSTIPGNAGQGTYIITGGQVVWQSGLTFLVAAAEYYINGTSYSSAQTSLTLGAADPSNPRIDMLVADDSGTVSVVAGTAAATPSEPTRAANQVKLATVTVPAGASAPTVTSTTLYAEDAGGPGEWNWTTSGTGWTLNSTNNPRNGTTCIEGTSTTAGSYAQGQIPSGALDPSTQDQLVLYIRSKALWASSRILEVQLLSSGVRVGQSIFIRDGAFGFASGQTSSYQLIAIPLMQFGVPYGTTLNQVRIIDSGGAIGFYLDDISFIAGGSTVVVNGLTQAQSDARYARRGNITETDLSLSDVTTDNVSSSKHGFVPKAPSDATKFLDGTGSWSSPSGSGSVGGGPITAAKSSDTSRVNTTTLANDPDLSFAVAANAIYIVKLFIIATAAATGVNLKFQFTLPSGATQWYGGTANGGSVNGWAPQGLAASAPQLNNGVAATGEGPLGNPGGIELTLSIVVGSTAGTCNFQWAQNTLDASNSVTVKAGSCLLAFRVK